jgi:hypothetical protein
MNFSAAPAYMVDSTYVKSRMKPEMICVQHAINKQGLKCKRFEGFLVLISYACDLLFSLPLAMRPPDRIEVGINLIPLYFLPTIIALVRNTDNKTTMFLINPFLGRTFIIWVITLVMALSQKKEGSQSQKRQHRHNIIRK